METVRCGCGECGHTFLVSLTLLSAIREGLYIKCPRCKNIYVSISGVPL